MGERKTDNGDMENHQEVRTAKGLKGPGKR